MERDYLERTIATVRNHRDADNCWPQWANLFADEIERLWGRVRELESALAWYADERRYRNQPTPDAERGHYPTHVPVVTDGGGRARAALAARGRSPGVVVGEPADKHHPECSSQQGTGWCDCRGLPITTAALERGADGEQEA